MSELIRVRVGGVPEHFNLPWLLAIEEGLFTNAGYDVEWIDFPDGTGAIMAALANGDLDMATPLTEGAVTAIANGASARFVSVWVDSPLWWGIHVAVANHDATFADLEGQRFAISRHGSGSELMARVLAEEFQWALTNDSWVVVGGLDGALEALPNGDAEIFLWNKSMTQPHVTDGTFARAGVLSTPWPSFAVASNPDFLRKHSTSAIEVSTIALQRAEQLSKNPDLADEVAERYDLALASAAEWAEEIRWTSPDADLDTAMITQVASRMQRLGRIDEVPELNALAWFR